jgi:hypothetical protein
MDNDTMCHGEMFANNKAWGDGEFADKPRRSLLRRHTHTF